MELFFGIVTGWASAFVVIAVLKFFFREYRENNKWKFRIFSLVCYIGCVIAAYFIFLENLPKKPLNDFNYTRSDVQDLTASPLCVYIEKYDPSEYNEVLSRMKWIYNNEPSDSKAYSKMSKFASVIFNEYLRSASDEALYQYQKELLSYLRSLSSSDPDQVCRFVYPELFGWISSADPGMFGYDKSFMHAYENVIKSGTAGKKRRNRGNYDGTALMVFNEFMQKFPDYAGVLSGVSVTYDEQKRKKLAKALIVYQDYVIKLPRQTFLSVYRSHFFDKK